MGVAERSVLVRLDAGLGVGFGHLMRCLAMSRFLVGWGGRVTISMRQTSGDFAEQFASAGVDVEWLPGEVGSEGADGPVWSAEQQRADADAVIGSAPEEGWDAVVVDHYRLDAVWEGAMRARTGRVVAIDDLANREHDVDILVDHNWYGPGTEDRYERLRGAGTSLLLGPRFAMLQPRYGAMRARRGPVRVPPRRVLVCFGGTDVGRQTAVATTALLDVPEMQVEVVVGAERAVTPELREIAADPRVRLHVALPDLVDLLLDVDLVIGAGGTATWERLCMGVPALVTTVSENQSGVTRAFDEAGITRWLGTADRMDLDRYREAIGDVMRGLVPTPIPIVDGHGAGRVALAVLPPESLQPSVRPANSADIASFVTTAAETDGPEVWRARAREFGPLLERGRVGILEQAGVPLGVVTQEQDVPVVRLDAAATVIDPTVEVL